MGLGHQTRHGGEIHISLPYSLLLSYDSNLGYKIDPLLL